MTPKEFIIDSINTLVKLFPETSVRYENHKLSNSHFVEVVPNEFHQFNEEYQKWEEDTTFNFIGKFPSQNLCFISEDALVAIENVEYIAKGELFDLIYTFNESYCQPIKNINIKNGFLSHLISPIVVSDANVVSNISELSYNFSKDIFANQDIAFYGKMIKPIEESVENNYALAA